MDNLVKVLRPLAAEAQKDGLDHAAGLEVLEDQGRGVRLWTEKDAKGCSGRPCRQE